MDFISRLGARTGMKAGFCVEKPRLISDGVFVMTPGNVRCILPRSEESLYLPMPRTTAMNPSSPRLPAGGMRSMAEGAKRAAAG